jgi:hemerythrin-like domain-containing protein
MTARHGEKDRKQWSARVTRDSHALELEAGVFTWKDPRRIARSLKRSAEASTARKAPPFRSAMSMLVFYINRAGTHLDEEQKRILEQAKDELRRLYTDD